MSCPTHGEDCNELCSQWRPSARTGQHDPEPLNLRQREVVALERIAEALDRLIGRWYPLG